MDKKTALQYIINHPSGKIDDLRKELGASLVRDFEYMGYIRNGVSSKEKTYRLTKNAKDDYDTFFVDTPWYSAIPSVTFALFSKMFS